VRRDAAVDMDIVERRGRVDDLVLTDRTDDFDFVRPDGGENFIDRLDFTALDGTTRTDTCRPRKNSTCRCSPPANSRDRAANCSL
jgi:hypothetical protein